MYFTGAKDGKYDSYSYKDSGLQLGGGSANTIRVDLESYLKAGSVIRVDLVATNDNVAIDLVPGEGSAVVLSEAVAKGTAKSFYYNVVAEDGFAGKNSFTLRRNNTAVLAGLAVADCGEKVPTAVENAEVGEKAVKVIENGQMFIIKNGVRYNAQGAIVK